MDNSKLIELTVDVVSAQVSNNFTPVDDVSKLIQSVFAMFANVGTPIKSRDHEPAVPIRLSVKHDYIICLEDGAKLKMLKRHLRSRYDLSPEEYRAKWNLPHDYPMVAPASAAVRRTLANAAKVGKSKIAEKAQELEKTAKRVSRKAAAVINADIAEPVVEAAKTGRKKLGIFAAKAAAVAHLEGGKPAPKPEQTKIKPARKARSKKSTSPML